jgi:hypothetical protein
VVAGASAFESLFPEVDEFVNSTLDEAIKVRDEMAPEVAMSLGEWGVTPKGDIDSICNQTVRVAVLRSRRPCI